MIHDFVIRSGRQSCLRFRHVILTHVLTTENWKTAPPDQTRRTQAPPRGCYSALHDNNAFGTVYYLL